MLRAFTASLFASLLLGASCVREPIELAASPAEQLRPQVDASLTQEPAGPVKVARDRELAKDEIVTSWNRDRGRLRVCVATHGALVEQLVATGGIPEPRKKP